MFFKQESWKISTYYIGNKMMVDIVDNGVNYESWIYHTDFGIKMFMFGLAKHSNRPDGKEMEYDDFIQIVRQNMPQYKATYETEYVD